MTPISIVISAPFGIENCLLPDDLLAQADGLSLEIIVADGTPNKDRSIFRKHVGRCLLAKSGDPLLAQWEIDLTTKASRFPVS
ncbi:MAG: hypothetical protein EXR00_00415 [Alphaproteobacteria bacterium]|nr:hypothetical protein [Alphaproteobacteria bacterium]